MDPSSTAARASGAARKAAGEGAATGGKVGAGAGVMLGAAAAPVMGPAFAVILAVGAIAKGAQIGGAVGAIKHGTEMEYPSPVVLRIHAAGSPSQADERP